MKATDADKGVNGQVKYSIVQQPNQKGTKFTVDEDTGKIYTNKVRSVYLPGAVRREHCCGMDEYRWFRLLFKEWVLGNNREIMFCA